MTELPSERAGFIDAPVKLLPTIFKTKIVAPTVRAELVPVSLKPLIDLRIINIRIIVKIVSKNKEESRLVLGIVIPKLLILGNKDLTIIEAEIAPANWETMYGNSSVAGNFLWIIKPMVTTGLK